MKKHDYKIGLVYIGQSVEDWFECVTIQQTTRTDALNKAASILKPNHLQTLCIVSVK